MAAATVGVLALQLGVVAAHQALQLGELADHLGDEIGLGEPRRALGQCRDRRRRCGASSRRQRRDALHALVLRAELLVEDDAASSFAQRGLRAASSGPVSQKNLASDSRARDHPLVAGDDRPCRRRSPRCWRRG